MINPTGPVSSPALTASMVGPGGKLGKDEFLKMLVAQLRNQDPLNPTKGEEFAAQLAQFSSLEQLVDLNAAVRGQEGYYGAMVHAMNGTSAMNALGRTVVAAGNEFLVNADGSGSVTFAPTAAGSARLQVFDEAGQPVATRELGAVSVGRQTVELDAKALGLPAGKYTYAVQVVDSAGSTLPAQTYTVGRVDGVRFGKDGPMLSAGPLSIPLGTVVEILTKE